MPIEDFALNEDTRPAQSWISQHIVDALTPLELSNLKMMVDAKAKTELGEINLSEELNLQYHAAKLAYAAMAANPMSLDNHKAALLNTCKNILGDFVKMQKDLYTTERMKKLEAGLLKALRTLPKEAQQIFFALYKDYAKAPDDLEELDGI